MGKLHQGVDQLKQNYVINKGMKELGAGAFGKVYQTVSSTDENHKVAIKLLDKQKCDQLDMIQ